MPPLGADDGTDLPTRVSRWVASAIIDGRWTAGQRLNEVHIAQELGLSRAPVREALRALGEQGMVTYRARVGCVVNSFTPTTVEELYTMRAVLERWCATEGTANLTAADIEQLERYLVPLEAAWVRNDLNAFYTHGWAMREIIYRGCGNSVALDEIRKLRGRLHSLPLVLHDIPEHSEWILEMHRTMVAAAKDSDASEVSDTIVKMLSTASHLVREAYEERYHSRPEDRTDSSPRPNAKPTEQTAL